MAPPPTPAELYIKYLEYCEQGRAMDADRVLERNPAVVPLVDADTFRFAALRGDATSLDVLLKTICNNTIDWFDIAEQVCKRAQQHDATSADVIYTMCEHRCLHLFYTGADDAAHLIQTALEHGNQATADVLRRAADPTNEIYEIHN